MNVRQYLLGRMLAEDEARYEESLLADPAKHAEVDAAVAELLDDYHDDRLAPDERRAVESRLLATAEGRFLLRTARALARQARAAPAPIRWRRWILFVAPALAAAAALALWLRTPPPGGTRELVLAETTRAATVPELVRGDAATVRLVLPLEPATITAVEIVGPRGLRLVPERTGATLVLPARTLVPGSYELVVTAGEPRYFTFRVR